MVVGIVWIAAHEVRACSRAIEPNHVRQSGLEEEGLVRRSEIVERQEPIDVALGDELSPRALRSDDQSVAHPKT